MHSHTGTVWKQSYTFVCSSPESGATFLFPTQEKVHSGKEKEDGSFPLSEVPGSALNLLQPFGKGRSSPSWQSVGTGSQIAREGGKESQHRLLSPHTPSPSPSRRVRLRYSPTEFKGLGLGINIYNFFERTGKAAAAHISLRLR